MNHSSGTRNDDKLTDSNAITVDKFNSNIINIRRGDRNLSSSTNSKSIQIPNSAHNHSINSKYLSVSGKNSWNKFTPVNNNINNNSSNLVKSLDARVLVDLSSPNFKTLDSEHHDLIVNSLRNNYINRRSSIDTNETIHSGGISTKSVKTEANLNSNITAIDDDDDCDNRIERNISTQGGDITRDIYKLAISKRHGGSFSKSNSLRHSKSLENLTAAEDRSRKHSRASHLNVPGGFRREYIVQKMRQDYAIRDYGSQRRQSNYSLAGNSLNSDANSNETDKVPFLTRNFLEFLYIYGNFAGESFEDDFITEEIEQADVERDERRPLLYGGPSHLVSESVVTKPMIQSVVGNTPTIKAFFLLLKSFIGTGILFLPRAFDNGGLIFSICMLLFFGIYSYWCYYILIRSKNITQVTSFGDIGYKLYGRWMKFVILFSLVLTQLGFAGAYVIFTAKNLKAFVENVFRVPDFDLKYLMIFQLFIFTPLSYVRNVSKLSFPSLVANFFIMSGLAIVIVFTMKHLFYDLNMRPEEGVIYGFNSNGWTLFIGTAIFAFEGIGLIIPIQDSMKHPEHFPLVLGLVIMTATVLFVTIATIGYLAYGKLIETVILLNLPKSNIFVNLIQLFYSMAIMLSTPLQLFPAIKIIENKVFPKFTKYYVKIDQTREGVRLRQNSGKLDWRVKWRKNFLRSVIVLIVILMAYYGYDDLDRFVSIIGSFACIPLVYMYPPMLHLRSYSIPSSEGLKIKYRVILDYILIAFGGVSMLYTSYQSLMSN
ncbi:hypothetical protein Kpol_1029p6 [Vanderwaltozyma polyspora DSM 70294]|uniref:Amino acid transporter transmembrane domain-containing protein n=1 Tax=Vanderwaltozyma polyspora (strain ATCC 22028 / DSM 70294 / BCRC 21397 / CBS 2163 / NBRC 10782 / NRRL Y-8283 / UCD 57-17) TaxID=436907 RepID=A7TR65_VANPO|nr:uncharacterized protein Kpol_1029p6 [Vanderwaltozyma polyspora DSM 70294]EDO15233.1 hypothetical protein Kpol_1029p6 [Vanderwaltozyma polyspora DSM 70294]